jgi:hypothetical protein
MYDLDSSEPSMGSDWCQTIRNGGCIGLLFLKSKNYGYFCKRMILMRDIDAFGDRFSREMY